MNRLQKIALFNLVFSGLAVMASVVAVAVLGGLYGWPKAFAGFGFLGIAGLGALALLIYKKPQDQTVELDERDHAILRASTRHGFTAAYLFFVTACMIPWFAYGPEASVSVNALPIMVVGGLVTHQLFASLTLLIQYRRGGPDAVE